MGPGRGGVLQDGDSSGLEVKILTTSSGVLPVTDRRYGRLGAAIAFDMDSPAFLLQAAANSRTCWSSLKMSIHKSIPGIRAWRSTALSRTASIFYCMPSRISVSLGLHRRSRRARDTFLLLLGVSAPALHSRCSCELWRSHGERICHRRQGRCSGEVSEVKLGNGPRL
jgi:hypothetical protein